MALKKKKRDVFIAERKNGTICILFAFILALYFNLYGKLTVTVG